MWRKEIFEGGKSRAKAQTDIITTMVRATNRRWKWHYLNPEHMMVLEILVSTGDRKWTNYMLPGRKISKIICIQNTEKTHKNNEIIN
jgi:hypothetical protein